MEAITDVSIVVGGVRGEAVPHGYFLIEKTLEGHSGNVNKKQALFPHHLYLAVKKDPADTNVVTALALILRDREAVPYGFTAVDVTLKGHSAVLNKSYGPVMLCVRKEPRSTAQQGISDIALIQPPRGAGAPVGFIVLDKDLNDRIADPMFLCYKPFSIGQGMARGASLRYTQQPVPARPVSPNEMPPPYRARLESQSAQQANPNYGPSVVTGQAAPQPEPKPAPAAEPEPERRESFHMKLIYRNLEGVPIRLPTSANSSKANVDLSAVVVLSAAEIHAQFTYSFDTERSVTPTPKANGDAQPPIDGLRIES